MTANQLQTAARMDVLLSKEMQHTKHEWTNEVSEALLPFGENGERLLWKTVV